MHTHARAHAEDDASPASSFFASSLPWSSFVFAGVNRNKRSSDSRLYINASRSLSISHTSSGGWSRLQRLFSSMRRCSSGSRPRSDATVTVARARAPPPPQAASTRHLKRRGSGARDPVVARELDACDDDATLVIVIIVVVIGIIVAMRRTGERRRVTPCSCANRHTHTHSDAHFTPPSRRIDAKSRATLPNDTKHIVTRTRVENSYKRRDLARVA